MNVSLEKAMITLVLGVFLATLAISFNALGGSITKEEAIEISKNSALVKEGMATYGYFKFGAGYYNSSWVEQMKKGHAREMYEKVPEGHGIWKVGWMFLVSEDTFIGYTVIVIIDAETGTIIHETKGVGFG